MRKLLGKDNIQQNRGENRFTVNLQIPCMTESGAKGRNKNIVTNACLRPWVTLKRNTALDGYLPTQCIKITQRAVLSWIAAAYSDHGQFSVNIETGPYQTKPPENPHFCSYLASILNSILYICSHKYGLENDQLRFPKNVVFLQDILHLASK